MKIKMSAEQIRVLFEHHLEQETANWSTRHAIFEPISYTLKLKAKRIRPVLSLLTYQAISGEEPIRALDLALALEMFHNFTLIHDDIMDNAPMRRGQATVHEKWNANTAILAGDALSSYCLHYLTLSFPSHARKMNEEFSRISLGVCEGQMEDMVLAQKQDTTVLAYIEMIRKKTAMLIGGAMSLAAIAAGIEDRIVQDFFWLGETAGIAFQIQDDYLDAFGKSAEVGKQIGGDIIENKNTFLLIRAKEKASGNIKNELNRLLNEERNPTTKVDGVLQIYSDLKIADETKERVMAAFLEIKDLRSRLSFLPAFAPLEEFLIQLVEREW